MGVANALVQAEDAFVRAMGARRSEVQAREEFQRSIQGARRAMTAPFEPKQHAACACELSRLRQQLEAGDGLSTGAARNTEIKVLRHLLMRAEQRHSWLVEGESQRTIAVSIDIHQPTVSKGGSLPHRPPDPPARAWPGPDGGAAGRPARPVHQHHPQPPQGVASRRSNGWAASGSWSWSRTPPRHRPCLGLREAGLLELVVLMYSDRAKNASTDRSDTVISCSCSADARAHNSVSAPRGPTRPGSSTKKASPRRPSAAGWTAPPGKTLTAILELGDGLCPPVAGTSARRSGAHSRRPLPV